MERWATRAVAFVATGLLLVTEPVDAVAIRTRRGDVNSSVAECIRLNCTGVTEQPVDPDYDCSLGAQQGLLDEYYSNCYPGQVCIVGDPGYNTTTTICRLTCEFEANPEGGMPETRLGPCHDDGDVYVPTVTGPTSTTTSFTDMPGDWNNQTFNTTEQPPVTPQPAEMQVYFPTGHGSAANNSVAVALRNALEQGPYSSNAGGMILGDPVLASVDATSGRTIWTVTFYDAAHADATRTTLTRTGALDVTIDAGTRLTAYLYDVPELRPKIEIVFPQFAVADLGSAAQSLLRTSVNNTVQNDASIAGSDILSISLSDATTRRLNRLRRTAHGSTLVSVSLSSSISDDEAIGAGTMLASSTFTDPRDSSSTIAPATIVVSSNGAQLSVALDSAAPTHSPTTLAPTAPSSAPTRIPTTSFPTASPTTAAPTSGRDISAGAESSTSSDDDAVGGGIIAIIVILVLALIGVVAFTIKKYREPSRWKKEAANMAPLMGEDNASNRGSLRTASDVVNPTYVTTPRVRRVSDLDKGAAGAAIIDFKEGMATDLPKDAGYLESHPLPAASEIQNKGGVKPQTTLRKQPPKNQSSDETALEDGDLLGGLEAVYPVAGGDGTLAVQAPRILSTEATAVETNPLGTAQVAKTQISLDMGDSGGVQETRLDAFTLHGTTRLSESSADGAASLSLLSQPHSSVESSADGAAAVSLQGASGESSVDGKQIIGVNATSSGTQMNIDNIDPLNMHHLAKHGLIDTVQDTFQERVEGFQRDSVTRSSQC